MNHRFKLHPDGTLEITMPKGKKVTRVLVCEAGTQNGTLMYPDCDDRIKHGGDWECGHVHCHPQNQNGRRGRWIKHDDEMFGLTYECSNCHIEGMINGNYCPNCGCQMNGGKQDERFKHSRTMHT